MRIHFMMASSLLLSATAYAQPDALSPSPHMGLPNAFFAMDTATRDSNHPTIESQLRLVKELGFAGWSMNADAGVKEALRLADELHLKLFAVYAGVDIDKQNPLDPKLLEVMRLLKGRDTTVWLFITSKKQAKPNDTADDAAVAAIRQVAAMAAESGLSVSLYPHYGFYMATARHALRLLGQSDRKNVTITFNLCHWLRTDRGRDLDSILREALPHLGLVTINGADTDATDWDRLIQPLGEGTFDVYQFLLRLARLGYKGPIGLQGFGVKGDVHEHLSQAMKTWREYGRRLENEKLDQGPR